VYLLYRVVAHKQIKNKNMPLKKIIEPRIPFLNFLARYINLTENLGDQLIRAQFLKPESV